MLITKLFWRGGGIFPTGALFGGGMMSSPVLCCLPRFFVGDLIVGDGTDALSITITFASVGLLVGGGSLGAATTSIGSLGVMVPSLSLSEYSAEMTGTVGGSSGTM